MSLVKLWIPVKIIQNQGWSWSLGSHLVSGLVFMITFHSYDKPLIFLSLYPMFMIPSSDAGTVWVRSGEWCRDVVCLLYSYLQSSLSTVICRLYHQYHALLYHGQH